MVRGARRVQHLAGAEVGATSVTAVATAVVSMLDAAGTVIAVSIGAGTGATAATLAMISVDSAVAAETAATGVAIISAAGASCVST